MKPLWIRLSQFSIGLRQRWRTLKRSSLNLEQKLLTVNEWSRPGTKLHKLRGIVLHWVENPMTDIEHNWEFFESRKSGTKGYGSAHFIIGIDGKVLQCIPLDEVAYHAGPTEATTKIAKSYLSNWPNGCTLGIEFCHMDWTGEYTKKTWDAGVKLCAQLCNQFGLSECDLYTHDFITKKGCPRWFVNHPDEFVRFEDDVAGELLYG